MNYWIQSSGTVTEVKPKNGRTFSVGELQKYVGGYFEAKMAADLHPVRRLAMHEDSVMFMNEDGKRLNLPVNLIATTIYRYGHVDRIVGDVLLTTREAAGG